MEKTITPVEEVEEKYRHSGVVVYIFDQKGRILVTRERHDKETAFERGALRKPDQLGIYTETREDGENWQTAFIRGVEEEFGLDKERCSQLFRLDPDNSYLGEALFREGVLATVIQIKCVDTKRFLKEVEPKEELDVIGFLPVPFLRKAEKNIRYGVKRTLNELIGSNEFGKMAEEDVIPLNKDSLELLDINNK